MNSSRLSTAIVLFCTLLIPAVSGQTAEYRSPDSSDFVRVVPKRVAYLITTVQSSADKPDAYTGNGTIQARYDELRQSGSIATHNLSAFLDSLGIAHRRFWVVPTILAELTAEERDVIQDHPDVNSLIFNAPLHVDEVQTSFFRARSVLDSNWGISHIGIPELWNQGFTGEGVVIGIADTGVEWHHSALIEQYAGWNGSGVDHNYVWHDAINQIDPNNSGTNPCGLKVTEPCDDYGHGTYVAGISSGSDPGGALLGVAPDAKWIGCRNMERAWGTVASYLDCIEWFLAPTDAFGNFPDPARAPDVVNNSWSCPVEEGCTTEQSLLLDKAIDQMHAAGIVVVSSAGNDGADPSNTVACSSISKPPSINRQSIIVGAIRPDNLIASFSSRGPVHFNGQTYLKPDVVAPGVDIWSTYFGDTYALKSGTSAAAPFVSGLAALLISADSRLKRNPTAVINLIRNTASPLLSDDHCGSDSNQSTPNNTFGYGLVNPVSAVANLVSNEQLKLRSDQSGAPFPNPADRRASVTIPLNGNVATSVIVIDALGKRIRSGTFSGVGDSTTNLIWRPEGIPAGIYVLLIDTTESVITRNIVLY